MFLKSFRIKSNSAVKGSVRKQLKREVSEQYPLLPGEVLDTVLPSKAGLHCVKYESGKNDTVSVYYVMDNNPIFFVHNGKLFPTVYTLWSHPQLVKCVATSAFVVKKLMDGADLMLPGVCTEKDGGFSLSGITVGQPLAVNIVGNRCAVAVGVSLISSEQIVSSRMRGKALEVLHIYGDHLWSAGTKQELPVTPYIMKVRVNEKLGEKYTPKMGRSDCGVSESAEEIVTATGLPVCTIWNDQESSEELVKLKVDDKATTCPDSAVTVEDFPGDTGEASGGLLLNEASIVDETFYDSEPEIDMDELLLECFLKTIKSVVKPEDLPLLTSTLYGSYMRQVCPSDLILEIKKSSYKKVSKFLSSLVSKGVIEISSEDGADSVTSINSDHELLHNFRPVLTKGSRPKTKEAVVTRANTITVEEVWSPFQSVSPLFSPQGVHKSSTVSSSDVREIVTKYVKNNQLVSQDNTQIVGVNPVLSRALTLKVNITSLSWKQLFSEVFNQMRPSFIIRQGSRETLVKNNLPKVKLTVCRRANKTVTLVDNLDTYGIPATEFSQKIQRQAACHSAVQTAAGASGSQVLIQGNQVKTIVRILEGYGLPVRLMESQDNVKPSKNAKRKGKGSRN